MAQIKKTYDFSSVGELQTSFLEQANNTAVELPIGILTPLSFDATSASMFRMSTALEVQIQDNLRNLLSTNHGERLLLQDFGANLGELAFDFSSEDIIQEALIRISTAVSKFMPFVSLQSFEPSVVKSNDGSSILNKIKIFYSVPAVAATNQVVEIAIVVKS